MKLAFTGTYTIDIEKEKARINKMIGDEIRARQLHLLDLFVAGKFNEWVEAYNKLPYDEETECSEREFVGMYSDIIRDLSMSNFAVSNIRTENS